MASFMKRIVLFLALNILIVLTISVILNLLGVRPYLRNYGIDYTELLIFCAVWGMAGSFLSLALSRVMVKWLMGVRLVTSEVRDPQLQRLVQSVHHLARAAHLPLPEVGIYPSSEINAFATGPTRSRSLVAVSQGLLDGMTQEELEGVLAHEVSHIANGDMVTMALLQGVVNAFVMFLSRVLAFAIAQAFRGDKDRDRGLSRGSVWMIQLFLEFLFMILGSMLLAWFSRYREYRADAGGARLAGREAMIGALERLQKTVESVDLQAQPSVQAMKISGRRSAILSLFATHPPLEDRIARLKLSC